MWGGLEAGTYAVGFRTDFHYDVTKPPVPYVDWDSNVYPTSETQGRQMQINIWYPVEAAVQGDPFSFGDYVDLMGRQTDFSEEEATFGNDQYMKKTNALGGNGEFSEEDLTELRSLRTYAYPNAKAAAGPFPLIIFPNGSSPAAQSILCEYLASHGFVVAAMALKGQHGSLNEASTRGIEMAVTDLEFAMSKLLDLDIVDASAVGLIGNAITSSHITAYQTRNSIVDCLVSLEGGLLSNFEQRLLQRTPFYEPEAVDVPILAIYAP